MKTRLGLVMGLPFLLPIHLQAQRVWVQVASTADTTGLPKSAVDTAKDAPVAQQTNAHRGGRGPLLSYLNAAGKWVFIVPMDDGSLYRSADGGKAFTKVFQTPWPNSRPQHAVRLANGVLYAAFAPVSNEISRFDGPGMGSSDYPNHNTSYTAFDARYELFRSADDGLTWEDTNLATTSGIPTAGNSVKIAWGDWWTYNSGHQGLIEDYWWWTDPGMGTAWSSISKSTSGCPNGGYLISGESTRTGGSAADNWASATWGTDLIEMGWHAAGGCGGGGGPNLSIRMPFGGPFNGENWTWCNTTSSNVRIWCMPARGGSVAAPDSAQTGLVTMWVADNSGYGDPGMYLQDGSASGPAGSMGGYNGFEYSTAAANSFYATTFGGQVYISSNSGASWMAITGSADSTLPFQGARVIITNLNSSQFSDNRLAALTQDVSGDNPKGGTRLWVWDAPPSAPAIQMAVDGVIQTTGYSICRNSSVRLSVSTQSTDSDGDAILYEWQRFDDGLQDWVSTGSFGLTLDVTPSGAAKYRVIAWDTLGTDQVKLNYTPSNAISFDVLPTPGFTQVPQDQTVCPLTAQTLYYRVSGAPNSTLTVQVFENSTSIPGLAPDQITLDQSGLATVVVTVPAIRMRNRRNDGFNQIYTYRVRVTAN